MAGYYNPNNPFNYTFGSAPTLNPPAANPGAAGFTPPASNYGDPNNPFLITSGFLGQNFTRNRTPAAPAGAPTANNPIYPSLTPPTTGSGNVPNWPDFTGQQSQLASSISNLLNPNDAQANFDVSMHGAERAAGTGTSGSPLATEYTGRLRQSDIERRTQLGAQLLSQQQDLALRDKFQTGQLSLQQAELALRDKIQSGELDVQQARLILDWYRTLYPNQAYRGYDGGGYGGGGGGGRAPTSGSAPTSPYQSLPPFPTNTDTSSGVWYDNLGQPHSPQDLPAYSPDSGITNFDWLSGAPEGTDIYGGTAYAPDLNFDFGGGDSSWLSDLYE